MRPVSFPQENTTLTGGPVEVYGAQVDPLPVFKNGTEIVSCWRPSLRERLSILIFGRVWLNIMGGQTHPPVSVWGARKGFE